jgi:hypothetical protein
MTRFEYDNTVRDLLGDTSRPSQAFPLDEKGAGFTNNAETLGVTQLLAEKYMNAAEQVVARAAANLAALVPCDPAKGDLACGQAFIDSFGKRAWRRPLDSAEKADMTKVFSAGMSSYGFATAIQMVMQVMLQVPQFLYRVEYGVPAAAAGVNVVKLSSWEMASRLSYMLWGSMPDDLLFAAAEMGKLTTKEEIAAQARRMLGDSKAREVVAVFHEQWLELDKIDEIDKDKTLYPAYDPALRPLFKQETQSFISSVLWDGDGKLATLLTASSSMMNAKLAAFYGVTGPTGDTFQSVALSPTQRSGILTHAGILSAHAQANQTDPVRRGKFVREQLLCDTLPPPPDDIVIKPPDLDPTLTTRERFAQHSADASCAGCHRMMDPIGLGFENYDALGRWRTTENGKPVSGAGELFATDVDGPFDGAVDLAQRLAGSGQVSDCVATQWFRFGYGRAETPADACSTAALKTAFAASGYNVRELLLALTQTDAFMLRKAGGAP